MYYSELDYLAQQYGSVFFDIAFEALSNAADVINCEKPSSRSSIALPEGITRYALDGSVEYCCRAKLLPNYPAPYVNSAQKLEQEFNSVATYHQFPYRFSITISPYKYGYVLIAAKPR